MAVVLLDSGGGLGTSIGTPPSTARVSSGGAAMPDHVAQRFQGHATFARRRVFSLLLSVSSSEGAVDPCDQIFESCQGAGAYSCFLPFRIAKQPARHFIVAVCQGKITKKLLTSTSFVI